MAAVVLGVPFGLLWAAAFALPWMQDHLAWWGAPAPLVTIAVAAALAGVNWYHGAWPFYVAGLVVAVPVLAAMGGGPGSLLLTALLLAGGVWGARRLEAFRRRRWQRTRVLLVRRESTDAVVSAVERDPWSSTTESRLVTLTAVGRPELSWSFCELWGARFAPRVGDPMVVWFDPAEPAVATVCAATPLIKILRPAPPTGP